MRRLGEWLQEVGFTSDTLGPSWLWPLWRLAGPITRQCVSPWQVRALTCPHCGFHLSDTYSLSPWLQITEGGKYAVPGEPTVHWFRGIQTCPRCRYQYEYGDSD